MSLIEIRAGQVIDVPEPADEISVSFFVPCYNEERNVIRVIEKLVEVTGELGLSYEILVFDDGSRDRTVEVVRAYQIRHPDVVLRLFVNDVNRGVARNFVEGAFHARSTYYRLVCGDDAEPVETLRAILSRAGEADIVIPYHTQVIGRALHRRLLSRLYTVLVNMASGRKLHYYNGLPLFRRRDVTRFHVEATGSGYQAEFLLRLLQENKSYIEIPLVASDRGSGSLNLRNFISVGFSLFKIVVHRIRERISKKPNVADVPRDRKAFQ
jgi:glycosyltransferase involved in cell wall biosynthesis